MVMRQGLVKLLSKQPDLEVVGEATNGREVIERARQIKPDVILLDTSMPDMGWHRNHASYHVGASQCECDRTFNVPR
jgi:DNA-binding NarL/FixJ family response regulator